MPEPEMPKPRQHNDSATDFAGNGDAKTSSEFLSALVHEFRNPLAPVRNAAEVLRSICTDPRQLEAVEIIASQTAHLTHLLDDVLAVAQMRRGVLSLSKQQVDAAAIAEQVLQAVRPQIDRRGQNLYVSLPAGPVQMHCDPVRLVQVLTNLLENATRYTPEGGAVSLRVAREEGQLIFQVSDNGDGISSDLLPRVFNLFAQGGQLLPGVKEGLGLGLAIARNLVEMHGGSIVAESAGIGQGSCFTVRLPIEQAMEEIVSRALQPAVVSSRRILIVEDQESVAKALASYLSLQGNTVVTAACSESALRLAGSFSPQIIIMNIGLPDGVSFQIARRLRKIPEVAAALLVAVSGGGLRKFGDVSDHQLFDHYLLKPSPEALLALIEYSMGRRTG